MCTAIAETPKQDSVNKANRHPHPSARCDCPSKPTPSVLLSHGSSGVNTFANFISLWFILKFFPVIQRSSFTWRPMSRELLGLPQTLCLPAIADRLPTVNIHNIWCSRPLARCLEAIVLNWRPHSLYFAFLMHTFLQVMSSYSHQGLQELINILWQESN